jgi:hypothetical protein
MGINGSAAAGEANVASARNRPDVPPASVDTTLTVLVLIIR